MEDYGLSAHLSSESDKAHLDPESRHRLAKFVDYTTLILHKDSLTEDEETDIFQSFLEIMENDNRYDIGEEDVEPDPDAKAIAELSSAIAAGLSSVEEVASAIAAAQDTDFPDYDDDDDDDDDADEKTNDEEKTTPRCPPNADDAEHPVIAVISAIPQPRQKSQAWLQQRKSLITASDVHVALNIKNLGNFVPKENIKMAAPYGSVKDFVIQKATDEQREFDKSSMMAMDWGTRYETIVSQIYATTRGVKVYDFGLLPHGGKYATVIGASIDGITRRGRLLEIKVPYNREITDQIPLGYWLQVQTQLYCIQSYCPDAPLDGADYIEGSFSEMVECVWWEDANDEDMRLGDKGSHRTNRDGFYKGVIGSLEQTTEEQKDGPPYIYPPLELSAVEKIHWLRTEASRRSRSLTRLHFWSENKPISVKFVEAQPRWFETIALPRLVMRKSVIEELRAHPERVQEFRDAKVSESRVPDEYKNEVPEML